MDLKKQIYYIIKEKSENENIGTFKDIQIEFENIHISLKFELNLAEHRLDKACIKNYLN